MGEYSVTTGHATVRVEGSSWLTALGHGLEHMGCAHRIQRLACEVLPNGTVIARDIATGTAYVVCCADEPEAEPLEGQAPILEARSIPLAAQRALQLAQKAIPTENGVVLLEEDSSLRFTAVVGAATEGLVGVRLPLGTGIPGFVMEAGCSVLLAHHGGEPELGAGIEQLAVVPIRSSGISLGVLELINPERRRFTDDDEVCMRQIADALGERLSRGARLGRRDQKSARCRSPRTRAAPNVAIGHAQWRTVRG